MTEAKIQEEMATIQEEMESPRLPYVLGSLDAVTEPQPWESDPRGLFPSHLPFMALGAPVSPETVRSQVIQPSFHLKH